MSANSKELAKADGRLRFPREYAMLEAWISQVPEGASVKGMFFSSLHTTLRRRGYEPSTNQKFVAFKEYPLVLYMEQMLDAAARAWPGLPPAEGLRSLGQSAYPTLAESVIGRVIFSVAAKNWRAALPLTGKAYGVSLNPGSARVVGLTDHSATLELRDVWNFADTYQVGVMEGAMTAFGVEGTVRPMPRGRKCDVDLRLDWE